jgi:hypothetical protein
MIYLFKKNNENHFRVYVTLAKSDNEIKKEMQQSALDILFIYKEKENSLEIVNEYYDIHECTYFIFKLLGIFKPASTLEIKYPLKKRNSS